MHLFICAFECAWMREYPHVTEYCPEPEMRFKPNQEYLMTWRDRSAMRSWFIWKFSMKEKGRSFLELEADISLETYSTGPPQGLWRWIGRKNHFFRGLEYPEITGHFHTVTSFSNLKGTGKEGLHKHSILTEVLAMGASRRHSPHTSNWELHQHYDPHVDTDWMYPCARYSASPLNFILQIEKVGTLSWVTLTACDIFDFSLGSLILNPIIPWYISRVVWKQNR